MLTEREIANKVPQGFKDLVDVICSTDMTWASGEMMFLRGDHSCTLKKRGCVECVWTWEFAEDGADLCSLHWEEYRDAGEDLYDRDQVGRYDTEEGRLCLLYFIDALRETGRMFPDGAVTILDNNDLARKEREVYA